MPCKKTKQLVPADPQKSSAAQFLTYVASTGTGGEKYEIRYEDENIWMSQKMLALVYGVEVNSINYHIKKLFQDAELEETAVIRKIRITGPDRHPPKYEGDPVSTFMAQQHAETEFEKFKVVQDRLFMSDYDRYLLELEA